MSLSGLLGISNAYAANAAPSTGQGLMNMLPLFIIIVLFMYLFMIRPQSKRAKEQRALMASLKQGDEIVTTGGILGEITKMSDNFIKLKIADGAEITMQKAAIAASLPKGTMKSV